MFFVHILQKKTRASNHLETCLAHEHAFLFHRVNRFEEIFGSICSQLALKKIAGAWQNAIAFRGGALLPKNSLWKILARSLCRLHFVTARIVRTMVL